MNRPQSVCILPYPLCVVCSSFHHHVWPEHVDVIGCTFANKVCRSHDIVPNLLDFTSKPLASSTFVPVTTSGFRSPQMHHSTNTDAVSTTSKRKSNHADFALGSISVTKPASSRGSVVPETPPMDSTENEMDPFTRVQIYGVERRSRSKRKEATSSNDVDHDLSNLGNVSECPSEPQMPHSYNLRSTKRSVRYLHILFEFGFP